MRVDFVRRRAELSLLCPPGGFTGGEIVIYEIFYGGCDIDINSFVLESEESGGSGTFFAAAHIQRTGGPGVHGWISAPIPEPSTAALLSFGPVPVAVRIRAAW